MAERKGRPAARLPESGRRPAAGAVRSAGSAAPPESPELRRLRRRIDALDRRIVALLNERARLGLEVGTAKAALGRRSVLDAEREREVLLRVAMANHGPLPQAELLAVYRRLILATRRLELATRRAEVAGAGGGATDARAMLPTDPRSASDR